MNRTVSAVAVLALAVATTTTCGATFHPISSVDTSTSGSDLWPMSNLIQGSGVGFDATAPHDKLAGGADGNWVTDAPGGFPSDYIAVVGKPVITLDLGADRLLSEISVWGYQSTNANGVSSFSLRFATDADGAGAFGVSIAYKPGFFPVNDDIARQGFQFSQNVTARHVEFTAEDNFFIAPGDGSGGEAPGGDRVGLGEIAFEIIPEPATLSLLVAIGSLMLLRRKRRS